MLKNEWKKLFQSKFMIVVMVAIILIPTIYTAIFVGAMWDPYGRLERLSVAVVNKDQPVMYNEKELNVGENYIASKMSETAVSKIQQSIREKITTQYADTVFEQLETIGDAAKGNF